MKIISAEVVLPISGEPLFQGAVVVDQSAIVRVGPRAELSREFPDAEPLHYAHSCLLPGLVNAHTHLDLLHFPTEGMVREGQASGAMARSRIGYVDWLTRVIQYRKSLVGQTLADSIREGLVRSQRSGTTCLGEISTLDGEFALIENTGLRVVLFPELISFQGEKAQDLFETAIALIEKVEAKSTDHLVRVGLSPHAPYTVSRPLLRILEQYASESRFPVQIHAAESFQEVEFFFDAGGEIAEKLFPFVGWTQVKPPCVRKTPVEYLHAIGFLRCSPTLIHAVQVSDADIDRMAETKTKVVICPRSNHFLGVGRAPLTRFLQKGIAVGLGTDSLASNVSLSMWDEMRFLWECANPTVPGVLTHTDGREGMENAFGTLSAREVLELATRGGARTLGLEREIGSLEPGKKADLIAVRLKEDDLTTDTVYASLIRRTVDNDIDLVMVNGRVLKNVP